MPSAAICRPHTSRRMAALAALVFGGMIAGGSALAGPADPSFDCKAARTKPEKAICADPALAALDRRIAAAYQKAMSALDIPGRTALRMDQRAFMEARDIQARRSDYDMKADLAARAAMLESIVLLPRPGFAGTWANVYGQVVVRRSGEGTFRVEISTVQPYPSYPTCDFAGSGEADGPALLAGGSAAERKENEGWTIRLGREGATLTAELQRPREGEPSGPPFCGFRSTIDGSFFPVSDRLADQPR